MNQQFIDIVRNLPDSILQPDGWEQTLAQIQEVAGVPHFLIATRDQFGELILECDNLWEHNFVRGYDGEHGVKDYLDYYKPLDGWDGLELDHKSFEPVLASHVEGKTLGVMDEFWEWLTPLDINENAYVKLFDLPIGWVGMNMHFNNHITDANQVLSLLKHIRKPLGDCIKLQEAGVSQNFDITIEQQLRRSHHPQIIVNSDLSVLGCNQLFEEFERVNSCFRWQNRKPVFLNSKMQIEYKRAIANIFKNRLPKVLVSDCSQSMEQFTIVIAPYEVAGHSMFGSRLAALVTILTKEHHAPLIAPFAQAHGFNSTQTAILYEVDKGKGPKQISEELGLSYTHIRGTLNYFYSILPVDDLPQLVALLGKLNRIAI